MGFHEYQAQTHQSNKTKSKRDEKSQQKQHQPLLIVVSTSLDGGEEGGGMIPTGGLDLFSYFWKCKSTSFSRQLETYCLLYQLGLGTIWHM